MKSDRQPCRYCTHWSGHDQNGRPVCGYTCSGICDAIEAERRGDGEALRRLIDGLAPMEAFSASSDQKH